MKREEWTLIVSIGNTIPFDLGMSQGRPDIRLELASGEGLLFNGWVGGWVGGDGYTDDAGSSLEECLLEGAVLRRRRLFSLHLDEVSSWVARGQRVRFIV